MHVAPRTRGVRTRADDKDRRCHDDRAHDGQEEATVSICMAVPTSGLAGNPAPRE